MTGQLATSNIVEKSFGPINDRALGVFSKALGREPAIYALKVCALYEYARSIEKLKDASEYVNTRYFNDEYDWMKLLWSRVESIKIWKSELKIEREGVSSVDIEAGSAARIRARNKK